VQTIGPESHFLRSGGSSLAAMRLAADLRRNSGLKLDVGAFLARPTFANFSQLARPDQPRRPDGYVLLGPADFTRVMLLVPGAGGQAAGLYALADELQRGLAGRTAVAIVDLDSVLHGAPPEDALSYVSQRIAQMVRDLGQSRVMGLVGFSLGGSLALQVVEALSAGPELPIWMLDTFAPRAMRTGLLRKVERRLAWMMFGDPEVSSEPVAETSAAPPQLPLRATEAQWAMLGDQLANAKLAAPKSKVRLIQARTSVQRVGLIWQRDNNGFVPSQYGQWRVHVVDGDHLDIPRHLAATTAGIIMGRRRLDASLTG
jgi:aryl carrier-like protein/thioesterase domain-containing protein